MGSITGVVIDVEKDPLAQGVIGALVIIKETGEWVEIIDESGYFEFNDLELDIYTIVVTRTGYKTTEVEVNLSGKGGGTRQGELNYMFISLIIMFSQLNEVLVNYYYQSDYFVTTIEIIKIKVDKRDDIHDKGNHDDEVYLIVDNVRYPHPKPNADREKYKELNYIYQLSDKTRTIDENYMNTKNQYPNLNHVICSRVSDNVLQSYKLHVSVYEDDTEWKGADWSNDDDWFLGDNQDDFYYDGLIDIDGFNSDYSTGRYKGNLKEIRTDGKGCANQPGQYIITLRATIVPFVKPDDGGNFDRDDNDWDGDGLDNDEEFVISTKPELFGIKEGFGGMANPLHKDIFLEIDIMEGVSMPKEGIVKAATTFAEKGIRLHIDDRCLGGDESGIEYMNTILPLDIDKYCKDHFKNKNPDRVGIFSYCIMVDYILSKKHAIKIEDFGYDGYDYGYTISIQNTPDEICNWIIEYTCGLYWPDDNFDGDSMTNLFEMYGHTNPLIKNKYLALLLNTFVDTYETTHMQNRVLNHYDYFYIQQLHGSMGTKSNFKEGIKTLKRQSNSNDIIFIMTIGHGDGPSRMFFNDGNGDDGSDSTKYSTINSWLNEIICNRMILLMGQCEGGGAIPAIKGENRIVMTSVSDSEVSFTGVLTWPFMDAVGAVPFCIHLKGANPYGAADKLDDKNGYVSISEAFQYGYNWEVYGDWGSNRQPQISDESNIGYCSYFGMYHGG